MDLSSWQAPLKIALRKRPSAAALNEVKGLGATVPSPAAQDGARAPLRCAQNDKIGWYLVTEICDAAVDHCLPVVLIKEDQNNKWAHG